MQFGLKDAFDIKILGTIDLKFLKTDCSLYKFVDTGQRKMIPVFHV